MMDIKDLKENPWIFSLAAGVVAIISLLTPYSSQGANPCLNPSECCSGFCWQWGLEYGAGSFGWVWQPYFIVGLFTAAFFFAGAAIMLVTGILARNREEIKFGATWSTIGKMIIFQIILFILYILMRNFEYFDFHLVGFGLIGPFISGVLAILAGRFAP